ncbi:MAG: 50S ribosomal protein L6 [Candidatus Aureabacteria bacterium]|nr:50S ribosomal protein L6 [Candidatus Auribacterota bacterium]
MSRVGKVPVPIMKGVKVSLTGNQLLVEGPKGKLNLLIPAALSLSVTDKQVAVSPNNNKNGDKTADKNVRALHGLYRALIQNIVKGVSEGYEKRLEINGVGFRAKLDGKNLVLALGYSHPIKYPLPAGITAKIDNKDTLIILNGIDKQLLGNVAAAIRRFYPPEPYKGKGIKYLEEVIRRKKGKRVA